MRGVGRVPLIIFLRWACRCGGSGISMNFGLSGPMKERRADTVKARDVNEAVEHRGNELNEFFGS